MQIEFTGRHITVTKKHRALAETCLERVGRLLGRTATAHVVLTAEKNRRTAEITLQLKQHTIVGIAESPDMEKALHDALVKAERQAVRLKDRIKGHTVKGRKKIELKSEDAVAAAPRRKTPSAAQRKHEGEAALANGSHIKRNGKSISIPVTVHSFPVRAIMHETHVVRTTESVALRPMTIEEAVKEAEFRDRDVFLFRDPAGGVKVLHRKSDGRIELIEEP